MPVLISNTLCPPPSRRILTGAPGGSNPGLFPPNSCSRGRGTSIGYSRWSLRAWPTPESLKSTNWQDAGGFSVHSGFVWCGGKGMSEPVRQRSDPGLGVQPRESRSLPKIKPQPTAFFEILVSTPAPVACGREIRPISPASIFKGTNNKTIPHSSRIVR